MSRSWLSVDSLRHDKGSVFLGLLDRGVVGHHAVQETLARLRVLHVFNSDVDALRDDATVVLKATVKNIRNQTKLGRPFLACTNLRNVRGQNTIKLV